MTKLRNEKYNRATTAEVLDAIKEAENIIAQRNINTRINIWGRWFKIPELLENYKQFEQFTKASQITILREFNFVIDYINKQIEV